VLLFFAPEFTGIDKGTDFVIVPQYGLGLGAVEATIGTEVAAALGQIRLYFLSSDVSMPRIL